MNHKIIVLGASGHAKVIADIIIKSKNVLMGFLDDNMEIDKTVLIYNEQKFKVLGKISDSLKFLEKNSDIKFVIAVGDNYARARIAKTYNLPYTTLIHPNANISIETTIGDGTVIMANAVVNAGTIIGKYCIINTGSIVEHDNKLANYVHISPNATLSGTVNVGEYTHIGANATVKNNINITNDCIIGAGAVVVKDIIEKGIYVGVPARRK